MGVRLAEARDLLGDGGEMARLWDEKHVPAHCENSHSDTVSGLLLVIVRCYRL